MRALVLVFSIVLACAAVRAHADEPTSVETFLALPRPAPYLEIRYGDAPSQSIDVFIPRGREPHPVAILLHGGCWRNLPGAGREQLRHLGADLAARNVAVWNIGYRRADEPGGGYPGTFEDVATAIDLLRVHADRLRLDLSRTVLLGHSAGGHLALWAAARDGLSSTSGLHRPNAFIPSSVISLAGVGDLEAFAKIVTLYCGAMVMERLVPTKKVGAYATVSPAAMTPPGAPVTMISGILDRLVPPYVAFDYAQAMRKKAQAVELVDIPGAGHFDLVTPGTAAWDEVTKRVASAVDGR